MAFRIYNAKSKEKIDEEDFGKKYLNNSKNLEEIEKLPSKKVEEFVNNNIEKAKSELNAEIFGFDDKMR